MSRTVRRAAVAAALVMAAPLQAEAQADRNTLAAPQAASPIHVQRGVILIPEGGRPLASPDPRPRRFLTVTGPTVVRPGLVRRNETFLAAPARHAVTGRLHAPLDRFAGWMSGIQQMPVGTPFYATQFRAGVTWCAPKSLLRRNGQPVWGATCFAPDILGRYRPIEVRSDGLFVTRAIIDSAGGAIAPPAIAEGPVDFGSSMRLAYRFGGWKRGTAALNVVVEHDHGSSSIDTLVSRLEPDGSARFDVLGAEIRLQPAGADAKDATVEILKEADVAASSPY